MIVTPTITPTGTTTTTSPPLSRHITKTTSSFLQTDGNSVQVRRSIGRMDLRNQDPFLLLDEFSMDKETIADVKNAGFPDHPHRGFETVTYMLEGQFKHEDFAGHKGTIGPGDLQWMTAGRGIVHSEMPVKSKDMEEGGTGRGAYGLQLWINLPKEHKMCEPQYQELLDAQIPRATPQNGVVIKVIAGESHGITSQVYTRTPTLYLDFKLAQNKTVTQRIPASYSGFIYVLKGTVYVGDENTGQQVVGKAHQTMILSMDGATTVRIQTKDGADEMSAERGGEEEAHFVLIAGEPIKEPVVQIGPFVMNSKEEVYETYQDYRDGVNGFERTRV
ncbi:MAG: RmlC-like cupin domain-containing protein [Linnemannia gamsii]|nr:MAG: RmlC-like cupin domain-containing protein [Linnemannia gamsii]